MDAVFVALVLFAAVGLVMAASWSATRLCVLEVEQGAVSVKSGGVAPGILSDIADVVQRPKVRRATLRISRRGGQAELRVTGDVSEAQKQQLRNVVGRVPLAKLRNARAKKA